jgi:hypothetical protein
MALNAIVGHGGRGLSHGHRLGTIRITVAFQARLSDLKSPFLWACHAMGIVAGDAGQGSITLDITSTGLHLLDMANRFGGLVLFDVGAVNQGCPDICNRVAWAKITGVATGPQDFKLALKVALVADVVPLDGVELGRINDRIGLTTCRLA